jgi:signal peptidase II
MPRGGAGLSVGAGLVEAPAPEARGSRGAMRSLALMLGLVTIPVIALDQFTKYLVRTHMSLYQSIAIIPHWLDLTYTINPGAAFSMFINLPPWFRIAFLCTLSSVAALVLVYLLLRTARMTLNSVAFALILAGALGNLIDRLAHDGAVIDFVRVHYYAHNYPIFNVADSAITIGVTLILVGMVFGLDGSGEHPS